MCNHLVNLAKMIKLHKFCIRLGFNTKETHRPQVEAHPNRCIDTSYTTQGHLAYNLDFCLHKMDNQDMATINIKSTDDKRVENGTQRSMQNI